LNEELQKLAITQPRAFFGKKKALGHYVQVWEMGFYNSFNRRASFRRI